MLSVIGRFIRGETGMEGNGTSLHYEHYEQYRSTNNNSSHERTCQTKELLFNK